MSESSVVTVLFTDLVGFTELKSRLGDTAADDVRRRHFAALRDAAGRHKGREVKTLGDGDMVVFTSPSDAVACAVDMQRTVAATNREAGESLGLRVGLHVGEATHEDDDYFGASVDIARRLCDKAAGGQIVASDLVRALASTRGSFTFAALGPLELKGVPEPVAAWAVDWRSGAARVPLPAALTRDWWGTYVGRAKERDELTHAVADACAGRRRVVLVAGEPGIGKTRLVAEVARAAHASGATVLLGRSDEGLAAPYQPFVESLSELAASGDPSVREAAQHGPEISRLVPELASTTPSSAVGDEGEQLRVLRAVDAFLAHLSTTAPVVLVLDDLHWADRSTVLLLRHLARSRAPASLCVLGTYRETELDRLHPLAEVLSDLRRERLADRVLLRGLGPGELAELVADRAGHDAPEDFVTAVHTETQGNPFFAEEVLRHLAETGSVYQRDGVWTTDAPVDQLGIPEGVREVVGRRLARLSAVANRALQVAAVVGSEFDARVVERAGALSADELLDALDESTRAGLVTESARPGRHAFSHAIVRQTLYAELGATRRVQLHWRVGEALEGARADASELARHYVEGVLAGDAGRAVDACLAAGERAEALSAPAEALGHYESVLGILDQAADDPPRRILALLGVVTTAGQTFDFGRARSATDQSRELARREGRGDWLAMLAVRRLQASALGVVDPELDALVAEALERVGDDPTPERAVLLAMKASADWQSGRALDVSGAIGEADRIAERTGDPEARFTVSMAKLSVLFGGPDSDGALSAYARAAERDRDLPENRRVRNLPAVLSLLDLMRGDRSPLDEALGRMERAASEGAWSPTARFFLAGTLRLAAGDPRDTKAKASELRPYRDSLGSALAQDYLVMAARLQEGTAERSIQPLEGFIGLAGPHFAYAWRAILGCLYVGARRAGDALAVLEQLAHGGFANLSAGSSRPVAIGYAADLVAHLSAGAQAGALLPHVLEYSGQVLVGANGLVVLGAADRAVGEVLAAAGRLDEAEHRYLSAIDLDERLGFHGWASWTRYWYARLLAERAGRGDASTARKLLDEVIAFTDDHGMAWLNRLARELSALD